ncbi:MAG: bifunctional oligoribonuclease/PAP phosphatase NrnA [Candidatus Neomarinimicrobiota bacterium]
MASAWAAFDQSVGAAGRILLSTHENPDGDGLGSQLAMAEHLKELGKDCRIFNSSDAPSMLQFLDPNGWLETYDRERDEKWLAGCDLAVVFDLGDFRRLRSVGEDLRRHKVVVATIDHHPQSGFEETDGEPLYAHVMLDYSAPSTGTLVWQYFSEYRSAPLTPTMADALYTALITDTGSFRYDNTDERAHRMAIDLIQVGVKPYSIHRQVYEERERSQIRLLGIITNEIQYSTDGRIGWCALTKDMFARAEARREDMDGVVEFIRAIKGVQVAVLLTELDNGSTKLSLRSKGNVSINDVAQQLGGGGHAFASGAVVSQPWRALIDQLMPLLEEKVQTLDTVGDNSDHGR